jgi:ribosomal protein L40E
LSALQRKIILVDEDLSKVVGKEQGTLVSYAELTKGIHDYVKNHDLRKSTQEASSEPVLTHANFCYRCGADLTTGSTFCDKCGNKQ